MIRESCDALGREQIPAVRHLGAQPCFLPHEAEAEIELALRPLEREGPQFRLAQRQRLARRLLQCQRHVEDRRAAEVARDRQLVDQQVERIRLVLVSGDRCVAHPAQQDIEALVASHTIAQRNGAHEQPDLIFQLRPRSAGDRAAHDDVALSGVSVQQHLQDRQQGHEQAGVGALAERLESSQILLVELCPHDPAVRASHGRAHMVGGQLEEGQLATEMLMPVPSIRIQGAAREQLPLPHRIVAVVDPRRR